MQDRRLAAIMFTDIVGYTALMGRDEDQAFKTLRKNREIQRPIINKYRGEWLKEMGDGILASFNSSSDAVRCAGEIQHAAKRAGIELRIGIHEGEVVFEGGDVLGDGVNVASRLEALSKEGSISVSGAVYKNIKNKSGITSKFIEEKDFKNVDEPVKVYEVVCEDIGIVDDIKLEKHKDRKSKKNYVFLIVAILIILITTIGILYIRNGADSSLESSGTMENDRSIAVLPFTDMSPNHDQEYFSDGIMDEILMHLFKIGDLKVTSRTSVMQYKETTKTVPEIANELGVAHVLEGSVTKAGDRVRIIVQLIDAVHDKHIWAESYDRDLMDIFEIQSEVAQEVASALKAEINIEAQRIIDKKPTVNPEAYELHLKARALEQYDEKENQEALAMYRKAIELDPDFSIGYQGIGFRSMVGATYLSTGAGLDPGKSWEIAKPYFEKAIELDPDNGVAHRQLAWALLWYEWDFKAAEKEYLETQRIFPNYSWTDYHLATGQFQEAYAGAIKNVEIDSRSSIGWTGIVTSAYFANRDPENILREALSNPNIKDNIWIRSEAARVYMYLKEYDQAITISKQVLNDFPDVKSPRLSAIQAISYLNTNRPEEGDEILTELENASKISTGGSPSFYVAMIYAQKGEIDLAFEWLEKSYNDHEVEMYWLKVEPPFEPLYDDPRFEEMLGRVGIP